MTKAPQADLADLTDSLIAAARKAGAEAADAIAVDGRSIAIDVREGRLEQAERAEGVEIGLRVLVGQRQACVAASDISARTLAEMAERAVAMARETPEDPFLGLADPQMLSGARDAGDLELADPGPEPEAGALEADALAAEAAARAVAGVTQVQSASASYSHRRIALAMTNGFRGGYARTARAISAVAIAGTGTAMERDWCAESRVFGADLPAAEAIGALAGARAVERLGARQPPTGRFPVLIDERVSGSVIGHLLSAINGAAVARGGTWARGLLGKQILPESLDLEEDPHRRRVSGSRLFDAEGLPTRPRFLVERGILTGWTLDLASGRKLGMPSTASAARGTSSPPAPAAGNISLTQGAASRETLMRDMGTGLWITSFIGATINPTTGDYSRGAAGIWIEDGAPSFVVNECTVAGNLVDMLRRLTPANDARAHLSHVVPSLLIEGMTLAGA